MALKQLLSQALHDRQSPASNRPRRATRLAKDSRLWATLVLVAVVALHLFGALPLQDQLRTLAFNLYQLASPRQRESAPVLIVDIDEPSLKQFGQWPWPRSLLSRLVDRVVQQGPAGIALDILMPEQDRSSPCTATEYIPAADPSLVKRVCAWPTNDELLSRSLASAPTVLGSAGLESAQDDGVRAAPARIVGPDPSERLRHFGSLLRNLPALESAAAGHALLSTDVRYGVVETIPTVGNVHGTLLPALSLELLRVAAGSPSFTVLADGGGMIGVGLPGLVVPTQSDGSMWIHYGHHDDGRFISAVDVLEGRIDPELLRRKLVIIGVSGLGLVDYQTTALGERVPGAEIHAQVLESIFDGTTLLRPRWALTCEAALMLLLGFAMIWGFPRIGVRILVPLMALAAALLWGGGMAAFRWQHWLLDVISPMTILLVMFGYLQGNLLIRGDRQRKVLELDLHLRREQAARIRGEMEAAMRIQLGILPDTRVLADDSRIDIAARMRPARMVGGDLYDFFMLDAHHLLFIVGDVCGKGVPASLFMVVTKTVCKNLALRDGAAVDPGELLRQASMDIARDNPEMFFVTVFVGILDLRSGELRYCNAGHDRPLLAGAGQVPTALPSDAAPPVCVVEGFHYITRECRLDDQRFLVVYTDGVTEACDAAQQLFGAARLQQTLSQAAADWNCEQLLEAVCAGVDAFVSGAEAADDLTLLVLRWRPAAGAEHPARIVESAQAHEEART